MTSPSGPRHAGRNAPAHSRPGDVVVGDLVIVVGRRPGARRCSSARRGDLEADESLLTGESVAVRKSATWSATNGRAPGRGRHAKCLVGKSDNSWQRNARGDSDRRRTEIGRIGTSLGAVESAPTPLQLQTRRLVRLFAAAGIGSSVFLAVVYGLLHGEWLQAVLAGITLAMATLPEEFPLVLTIFLVLGAWRISKSKVLARRSAAIEALGATTVLCTDKTGTITMNRMSVAKLMAGDQELSSPAEVTELPEAFHELVEFSILASRPDPVDPMERAFNELGERFLNHTEHLHADWTLAHGYPLRAALLAMSQVWQAKAGSRLRHRRQRGAGGRGGPLPPHQRSVRRDPARCRCIGGARPACPRGCQRGVLPAITGPTVSTILTLNFLG